jgi:ribokinase
MNQNKIIVVGSSNTDLIVKLDRIPGPGETIVGGAFTTASGGKGANQAVAAARAGGNVTLIARVGRDAWGDQAVAGFRREGIDVDYVFRDESASSGVALIFVAKNGENSIGVALGANANLSPADIVQAKGVFDDARVLLIQLEIPLESVETAIELAAKAGLRIILNPAPARQIPDAIIQRVSILTPNEHEAQTLTGVKVDSESATEKAANILLARGAQTVIITLGARGVFVAYDTIRQMIPGYPAEAVDSTAAGDIFNGALAVMLAEGQPLMEAIGFAQAAAAISVTRLGAQTSAPSREEIHMREL